jgi:hypothetical protein
VDSHNTFGCGIHRNISIKKKKKKIEYVQFKVGTGEHGNPREFSILLEYDRTLVEAAVLLVKVELE